MTIRPHSQKNQIEAWKALVKKAARLEEFPQVLFVLFRSLGRAGELSEHAMNVKLVCRQSLKHRFIGHSEVAIGVIGGNVAFVPKKEVDLRPGNPCSNVLVCRNQLVEGFRC